MGPSNLSLSWALSVLRSGEKLALSGAPKLNTLYFLLLYWLLNLIHSYAKSDEFSVFDRGYRGAPESLADWFPPWGIFSYPCTYHWSGQLWTHAWKNYIQIINLCSRDVTLYLFERARSPMLAEPPPHRRRKGEHWGTVPPFNARF